MSATIFISPLGTLDTSLKALTSSTVTMPSAFAILAPMRSVQRQTRSDVRLDLAASLSRSEM